MPVPYTFSTASGSIPLNQLDANFGYLSNVVPDFAVTAGTVTTPVQSNITAVGTLSSLSVTGGISAGSISASQISGILTIGSQPNITEIGTLSDLTVTNTVITNNVICNNLTAPFEIGRASCRERV